MTGSSLLSKDGILPASAQELETESSLRRAGTEKISLILREPSSTEACAETFISHSIMW